MAEGGNVDIVNVEDKVDLQEFTVKSKNSDVTFIVEDQQVYASRVVLSIASPVFSELFEKNKKKEVEVPGIKLGHFVEFLKCIYPDILQDINETTVYWVVPLAHKYQVKVLRGKCIQLLLNIIKKNYAKNAEELYRHIKLSELLDLQEVVTLCVAMASECSLDELVEANTEYPILHETDDKIIKMALRRHEIARQDEEIYRSRSTCNAYLEKDIHCLLENKSYYQQYAEEDRAKNCMQALRLCYRYVSGNRKDKALKEVRALGHLEGPDMEIYRLLPEVIKRDLEKKLT
ncbi:uncharacterized protein LOC123553427 [Mercenaria mercenaria]|uniref:uncharacterized protein LOC123553427 n=1 Tax=Mercenaria mercenaria TaxID=6596 RepID=UPI00234EA56A|nr:uncharacterized protein LOC123553427 [Mercenaria mercenaria]